MKNLIKYLFISLPLIFLIFCSKTSKDTTKILEQNFVTPPDSIQTSVYWYWVSDNISEEGVVKDVVFMKKVGIKVVLVHGGSRQLNQEMLNQKLLVEHVDGLRVTSEEVLNLAADVFYGISLKIKEEIEKSGYKCAVFDRNSGLVRSKLKDPKLGFVGEPQHVDTNKLDVLSEDVIPVISAITSGMNPGDIGYNVNADDVAGAIAGAIKAEKLILMTDVDGVMDHDGQLVSSLTVSEVYDLIKKGIIHGGMIPKVSTCLNALEKGTGKCHIIRGGVDSFINEILTDKGVGTEFVADDKASLSSFA